MNKLEEEELYTTFRSAKRHCRVMGQRRRWDASQFELQATAYEELHTVLDNAQDWNTAEERLRRLFSRKHGGDYEVARHELLQELVVIFGFELNAREEPYNAD